MEIDYDKLGDETPVIRLGRRYAWFRVVGWGDEPTHGVDMLLSQRDGNWIVSLWVGGVCVSEMRVTWDAVERLRRARDAARGGPAAGEG